MSSNIDFAAEGFLQRAPGREFLVQGHRPDNTSGLLALRAVVKRNDSDDVIELGTKQGLTLHATFDLAHPDLAMLETIGDLGLVERLARDLEAAGYHRLAEK